MKNSEWFVVSVRCKKTDHKRAPDVVLHIKQHLKKIGIQNIEVTFDGWGDEPATPRRIDNPGPKR